MAATQDVMEMESEAMRQLHAAALAEGGKLVIYAGGDTPVQQDAVKAAFQKQFSGIDIQIVVDYSKFHDVRLDNQFANNAVVPDVIQLQTLQNFPRWKRLGRLQAFKPTGFEHIHTGFKDADGAWMAIGVIAFSCMYDSSVVGVPPTNPQALVDPVWRGKIASSYPHDDDAVLFLFKRYAETYGWDWIRRFAAQEPAFARGSHTPRLALTQQQKQIGVGGSGSLLDQSGKIRWFFAEGHPFLAWGQRAAIVKGARNLSAAKLYMSWQTSRARQQVAANGWSIRTDTRTPDGLRPVWEYANANLPEFVSFMDDRAEAERWRQTFAVYFGEVKGDASPGWLGLRPGA
ncbi:ABC transporter substrate-binding protein [Curvibacter sp. CHRR-16]|uniref:ABC transporter substrate-binding protein n=1 Tax=Curvibacter sp. CHRR-16 TaxID=2835872 RepID=UPI002023A9A3|nr:ABC transporter substrate-binding protein [Curvibacter sp. CHRR-16]